MIEKIDNIKTGLDALDHIDDSYYDDEKEIIRKELKALEIIKKLPIILHNNVIYLVCKSSEDAEKIKEFLKNDN